MRRILSLGRKTVEISTDGVPEGKVEIVERDLGVQRRLVLSSFDVGLLRGVLSRIHSSNRWDFYASLRGGSKCLEIFRRQNSKGEFVVASFCLTTARDRICILAFEFRMGWEDLANVMTGFNHGGNLIRDMVGDELRDPNESRKHAGSGGGHSVVVFSDSFSQGYGVGGNFGRVDWCSPESQGDRMLGFGITGLSLAGGPVSSYRGQMRKIYHDGGRDCTTGTSPVGKDLCQGYEGFDSRDGDDWDGFVGFDDVDDDFEENTNRLNFIEGLINLKNALVSREVGDMRWETEFSRSGRESGATWMSSREAQMGEGLLESVEVFCQRQEWATKMQSEAVNSEGVDLSIVPLECNQIDLLASAKPGDVCIRQIAEDEWFLDRGEDSVSSVWARRKLKGFDKFWGISYGGMEDEAMRLFERIEQQWRERVCLRGEWGREDCRSKGKRELKNLEWSEGAQAWELEAFFEFFRLLQDEKPISQELDKWWWQRQGNGRFTVASFFIMLLRGWEIPLSLGKGYGFSSVPSKLASYGAWFFPYLGCSGSCHGQSSSSLSAGVWWAVGAFRGQAGKSSPYVCFGVFGVKGISERLRT
ncbi:hypothetical protein Acr_01g0008920 [Actinidia rufa]|uniref:Uncharacterized protein n=1 Tax=Actinidia rufa TaxID=165716 RepID=A0A7J0E3I4_9ERIC|nr:hypothetical protein Acr_01g0008920 [Actinidia rufa]